MTVRPAGFEAGSEPIPTDGSRTRITSITPLQLSSSQYIRLRKLGESKVDVLAGRLGGR